MQVGGNTLDQAMARGFLQNGLVVFAEEVQQVGCFFVSLRLIALGVRCAAVGGIFRRNQADILFAAMIFACLTAQSGYRCASREQDVFL